MILNYFPHTVWATEDDMVHLKDRFYMPLLMKLTTNLTTMDNRQFLSTFQGLALAGPKIFSKNLLN